MPLAITYSNLDKLKYVSNICIDLILNKLIPSLITFDPKMNFICYP